MEISNAVRIIGPVPGKGGKTTNYDDGKKEAKGE